MTDFFILAVAVFAAVLLGRVLTRSWRPLDESEEAETR